MIKTFKTAKVAVALMGSLAVTAAASAGADSADNTKALQKWAQAASSEVGSKMTYSNIAMRHNMEGVASYQVTVDRDGELVSAEPISLPRGAHLKTDARRALRRMDLPALPASYADNTLTFQLNMNYEISNSSFGVSSKKTRTGVVRGQEIAGTSGPAFAGIILPETAAAE